MSRCRAALVLIFITVLAATALAAAPPAAADRPTVGHFLIEIAKIKNLPATDGNSAAAVLRNAGYRLPNLALDKNLTQGDVASIAGALGMRVTTSKPDAPFTFPEVGAFLKGFGTELGSRLGRGTVGAPQRPAEEVPPWTKGKGKKKGHYKTPSDPQ